MTDALFNIGTGLIIAGAVFVGAGFYTSEKTNPLHYRIEQVVNSFAPGRYCLETYVWDNYKLDILLHLSVYNFSENDKGKKPYNSLKSIWHVPEITDSVKQSQYNAAVNFLDKHKKLMGE